MPNIAIEINNLTKKFSSEIIAVDKLNLSIQEGTVCGLIGRSGCGKTTLFRLLLGLLIPDHGIARIFGCNLLTASTNIRSRVAYVSQSQQLYEWMTLSQLCKYLSYFYEKWDQEYADSLAKKFDLDPNRQIGSYSGGQKQKASILLALSSRSDIILLDEPAASLDPISRREFIDELVDVLLGAQGRTILFSTHIIGDLERIADHIAIMDKGSIVLSSKLDELGESIKRVQIVFNTNPPDGFKVPGAIRSYTSGPVVNAVAKITNSAFDEIRSIKDAHVDLFPLGLEDIFIEIVNSANKESKEAV